MKKVFSLMIAALLLSGASYACADGKKCAKDKSCCKKEGKCSKDKKAKSSKTTTVKA